MKTVFAVMHTYVTLLNEIANGVIFICSTEELAYREIDKLVNNSGYERNSGKAFDCWRRCYWF